MIQFSLSVVLPQPSQAPETRPRRDPVLCPDFRRKAVISATALCPENDRKIIPVSSCYAHANFWLCFPQQAGAEKRHLALAPKHKLLISYIVESKIKFWST
jgi:hypothetical protein